MNNTAKISGLLPPQVRSTAYFRFASQTSFQFHSHMVNFEKATLIPQYRVIVRKIAEFMENFDIYTTLAVYAIYFFLLSYNGRTSFYEQE